MRRFRLHRSTAALLPAALATVALLVGCNPGSPLLSDLFVPLPPPQAKVKNPPRHSPPPKKQEVVVVQQEIIKPPEINWASVYQSLPRDTKGVVDWMRALDEKTITPKPGVAADAAVAATYDSEIEFFNEATPEKKATFRHTTHTQWLGCKSCHSTVFKKRSENLQFTHDDMDAGKFCGACHSKVVVLPAGCKGCHVKKNPA